MCDSVEMHSGPGHTVVPLWLFLHWPLRCAQCLNMWLGHPDTQPKVGGGAASRRLSRQSNCVGSGKAACAWRE